MKIRKIGIWLLLSFIVGCATTTAPLEIIDNSILRSGFKISRVVSQNVTGSTYSDIDIEASMNMALTNELQKAALLSGTADGSEVSVRITQYEKGSAFSRWLMPGAGKTILSVEVVFKEEEKVIAQTQVTRSIGAGGGYTIGAWKYIFNEVAEAIVEELKKARS